MIVRINQGNIKAVVYTFKSILGRCFHYASYFQSFRQTQCILERNFSFGRQVLLVCHQNNVTCAFTRCILHIAFYRSFKLHKALLVTDVENCDTAMSISVVSLRNRSKSFLTSCIPHLQFDLLIVNLQTFHFEIEPDGAPIGLVERVLNKAQ